MGSEHRLLKDKLGGGSLRDIAPLVRKVKGELEQAEAEANAVPEMPEDILAAAEAIWVQAYRHAEGVAAAERRDKAAAAARHEAEMAEADEQLGAVEADLEAAQGKVAELEAALAEAMTQLETQRLEIARLEGRIAERDAIAEAIATAPASTAKPTPKTRKPTKAQEAKGNYEPLPGQADLPFADEKLNDPEAEAKPSSSDQPLELTSD